MNLSIYLSHNGIASPSPVGRVSFFAPDLWSSRRLSVCSTTPRNYYFLSPLTVGKILIYGFSLPYALLSFFTLLYLFQSLIEVLKVKPKDSFYFTQSLYYTSLISLSKSLIKSRLGNWKRNSRLTGTGLLHRNLKPFPILYLHLGLTLYFLNLELYTYYPTPYYLHYT